MRDPPMLWKLSFDSPAEKNLGARVLYLVLGRLEGRYFFNKRNISPYVGGGLGLVGTAYRTKNNYHRKRLVSVMNGITTTIMIQKVIRVWVAMSSGA